MKVYQIAAIGFVIIIGIGCKTAYKKPISGYGGGFESMIFVNEKDTVIAKLDTSINVSIEEIIIRKPMFSERLNATVPFQINNTSLTIIEDIIGLNKNENPPKPLEINSVFAFYLVLVSLSYLALFAFVIFFANLPTSFNIIGFVSIAIPLSIICIAFLILGICLGIKATQIHKKYPNKYRGKFLAFTAIYLPMGLVALKILFSFANFLFH